MRNNLTAPNVDPSGRPIQEPDVILLKISHDGKWLATVDEWTPPKHDLQPLYPLNDDFDPPIKETFLKFWARNDLSRSWELVSKVEGPYSTQRTAESSILDLETNPRHPEFSTASSDGSINIWTPKSRHRHGFPVTGPSGSSLYTWTCTHTIEIPAPLKKPIATASALAYSPDGSVLAASSNKNPFVHFIDPLTGNVQHTHRGSHPGLFSSLTFVGHHLITISKDLRVYNTVSSDLLYALALSPSVSDFHLAANQLDHTFAVVFLLPAFIRKKGEGKAKARSQIMVFNLKSATPIFRKIVDGTVEILLPLPGESGYLIINDEADIVYLRQVGTSSVARRRDVEVSFSKEAMRMTTALEDIFGSMRSIEGPGEIGRTITDVEDEDDDKRAQMQVVAHNHKTPSSLSDIFPNQATNIPVRELFDSGVAVLHPSHVR